jgi:oligopeptide transport system ATP-binding protein
MNPMNDLLLDVDQLEIEFITDSGLVKAVNGISYTLCKGETIGIVGESGSGKSVGVMALLQLIPCPPGNLLNGTALFKGVDLLKMNDQTIQSVRGKEIAIIFQDPMTSLNPVMSISQQLTEAMELHLKLTHKQALARAVEMLQLVGISDAHSRVKDYPHQFSGGMRQRVMIAMALACNPSILIADEPTTALDVTIQAQILRLVKKLRSELKMSIIWITHDLGVTAGLAEKILVMYSGYIVEKGPVDSLYHNPAHPYTKGLLGSLPGNRFGEERLLSIDGMPPDMTDLPAGCPFAPRCSFVFGHCHEERPLLTSVGNLHDAACWVDVHTGKPR